MMKRDFESEYRQMMIGQAAQDRLVRGTFEWLLRGKTDLVSVEYLKTVDEADLAVDTADYWGLSPEETQQAFELCEDMIMEEAWYV